MFKTNELREVGGFDETMAAFQDWEVYLRFTQLYEVSYAPEVCVRYHEYVGERISKNHSKRIEAFEIIKMRYKDRIKEEKKSSVFWG